MRLSLHARTDGSYVIAHDTQVGEPSARVVVDSCMTVMTSGGSTLELLLLVELDPEDLVANVHVLPLHRSRQLVTIVL
ncbi:hypothetical protein [Planktotalea sp.]|uniref:hypothetical protein n=1 Tax=Planktotalea sp. TaxID=2029877 RepID=UPI003450EDE3